jgi:hypothetical protein
LNVGKIFVKVAKVQGISEVFPYNKEKGKIYISPSNYHPIDNVPSKLSIMTMFLSNYQNIINVPPKVSKKIKMPLYISQ